MENQWRCSECNSLLGVESGVHLRLRHKRAQYVVDGGDYNVIAVCRNCSTINERSGGKRRQQPVTPRG